MIISSSTLAYEKLYNVQQQRNEYLIIRFFGMIIR